MDKKTEQLIAELKAKRDAMLAEKPELIPFQEELDRIMDNSGTQQNRMKVLGILMEGKLRELHEGLLKLRDSLSLSDED